MSHAIKIEDLQGILTKEKADIMVDTFKEILSDIGMGERIEEVNCRNVSGFIPFSHNKGGISSTVFIMNTHLSGGGYDYGDNIIEKWYNRQQDMYKQDHPLLYRYLEQYWDNKRKQGRLTQSVLEHYWEYIDGDSDYDSTMFEIRFMVLKDGSVDVDAFGCTNDAPYFRSSDYNEHVNITFKSPDQFKGEVEDFLSRVDFINLILECY